MRLRVGLGLLGIASALGYLSVVARITGRPVFLRWGFPLGDFLIFFLLLFALLFCLALGGMWWTLKTDADDGMALGLILGFAVLFRLVLLPTPPVLSSDIFRYVWDARIQAAGLSPYLSAPADFKTEAAEKDPIYQQQNRPFARTIYPPLAQAAFRAVRAVAGESLTGMKGLMVLADLFTLVLLVQLLRNLGLPRSRVILYGWHPLAVFEFAGSGHVDALAIPLILLAILAWQRGQNAAVGVAIAAATLVKIYPLFLLPAFFGRRRRSMLLGCMATILLGYLPFLPQAGGQVLGHLPRFLTDPNEGFNPSLMRVALFLTSLVSHAPEFWASWIGRAALLGTLAWLMRSEPDQTSCLLGRIWVVGTAMTLYTLTLHPWYVLWLVPLLAIQPRPAWIYLSGAIAVSYSFYLVTPPTRIAIAIAEYLPFLFLVGLEWRRPQAATAMFARRGTPRDIP